jgi:hypothetical protein
MGGARVVEAAFVHPAVSCGTVSLRPDAGELGEIPLLEVDPWPDDRGEEL